MNFFTTCIFSCVFLACSQYGAAKRPFYVIGHMANSIEDAAYFLKIGANALEFDIQFHSNGSVAQVYHGIPCDCFRICTHSAPLPEYLTYMRQITDPVTGNYSTQMVFQFFDLKLNSVAPSSLYTAGVDIAKHVLDFLWGNNTENHLVRVLLFLSNTSEGQFINGFRDTFASRGKQDLLDYVGFDGGLGNFSEIRDMFRDLGVESNIWIGDGATNCLSPTYPDGRLKDALGIRDSNDSFIDKVYHWTIDESYRMRLSLRLGIDGMITNVPRVLQNVLNEVPYQSSYRLATTEDNPFIRFRPRDHHHRTSEF